MPLTNMVPAARFGDNARVQNCVTTSCQAAVKGEYAAIVRICRARSRIVIPRAEARPASFKKQLPSFRRRIRFFTSPGGTARRARREGVKSFPTPSPITPPRALSGRDPPPPGEDEVSVRAKNKSFSRRDVRPSHAVQRVKRSAEQDRVTPGTGGGTGFGSIMPDKQKGSRTPPGAFCLSMSRISGCGARLNAARSPDGVPPRYSRQRTNAAAQLRNALPGTRLPAGLIRRPLSRSSDKVADRSSCRPGVFPKAARERR